MIEVLERTHETDTPAPRRFVARHRVRTAQFGNSAVVLDREAGKYYSFGSLETEIWNALLDSRPIRPIVAKCAETFGQPETRVAADVEAFLKSLTDRGLLFEISPPAPTKKQHASARGWPVRFRSWHHLLRVWFILKLFGFSAVLRTTHSFPLAKTQNNQPFSPAELVLAFERAAMFDVTQAKCLQQSCALVCFLRGYGIPAECVIGVRREPFLAHAWTELGGAVLAGTQTPQDFYVIERL